MAKINLNGARIESYTYYPVLAGSSVTFDKGDLLWWDATNETVKKASSFTWQTSEKITRQQFKRLFAGVAMESQFADSAARIVKVAVIAEVDATITSSTVGVVPNDSLTLVGPESSASLLLNQTLQAIQDPSEAIGVVLRRRSTAVTTARVLLISNIAGLPATRQMESRVWWLYAPSVATAQDKVTNAKVEKIFGGAIEVLALIFIEEVAITTKPLKLNLEKGTVNLATLTVALTGAAIGRVSEADMSADSSRFFAPNDNFSIEVAATAPSAGAGMIGVRYRPLS